MRLESAAEIHGGRYDTVRQKKVIFCPHVLMVIFPFLGGKNDGK